MQDNKKWYRDILFDTLRITPHKPGVRLDENLFTDFRKFPDGKDKIQGLHTNLDQCGYLGVPREFKAYYWGVAFEETASKDDAHKILKNLKLRLVFGSNVTMAESSLSMFSPTLFISDGLSTSQITEGYRINHKVDDWKVLNEQVGDCLKRFNLEGVWTHYHRAVYSEKCDPLYIDSTLSFRVQATMQTLDLSAPAALKVMLMGMELKHGSPPW